MTLRESATFVRQVIRRPRQIGAVWPTSAALALRMVEWMDWSAIRRVVEVGPGTGAFTSAIVRSMHPDARLLAIEINPALAAIVRTRFPTITVCCDSVANLPDVCRRHAWETVDAVISGLPWAAFGTREQRPFLAAIASVLRPSGSFAAVAYVQGLLLPAGRHFRALLADHFARVTRGPTVWTNIPPGFAYQCVRQATSHPRLT